MNTINGFGSYWSLEITAQIRYNDTCMNTINGFGSYWSLEITAQIRECEGRIKTRQKQTTTQQQQIYSLKTKLKNLTTFTVVQ